jgi:uncharacterized protein (DUF58 family)
VPAPLSDPAFFSRLDSLELRARSIVEGFLTGLHRSPFVGFSVEFASHREYVAGDDPRYINWKLYARQRRLFVKEFDAETNMNLYVLLDASGSMECANSGCSKREYGSSLAAALSHLALRQRDAVGITLFADTVLAHLAPKAKPHQWDDILRLIDRTPAKQSTDSSKALQQAAELCRHRGMVVVISDLFDDKAALVQALEQLRFRNHEVLLFHLWDPWERNLPVDGNVRFHDLETGAELSTRVEGIRDAYREAVDEWRREIETECRNRAIDRVELTTDEPLDKALLDYLVRRAKVM